MPAPEHRQDRKPHDAEAKRTTLIMATGTALYLLAVAGGAWLGHHTADCPQTENIHVGK